MKVFVVTRKEDPSWVGGESAPLAVVADAADIGGIYQAKEFIVIGAPGQETHIAAFNQVANLSKAAKVQAGITGDTIELLRQKAEGDVSLKTGDTVWLSLDYKPARIGGPATTGAYQFAAGAPAEDGFWPLKLLENATAFAQQQEKVAAMEEFRALPVETRKCLRAALTP
jgi:hypothetical protein